MNSSKDIFITGASGFVGSNLVPYLKDRQFSVDCASLRYPGVIPDLNYSAVIHLSGKAHDLRNASSDQDYLNANFELTKALYAKFLQSPAQVFIYISSVKAVADHADEPVTESTVPNPLTIYGKSKQMAEAYILTNMRPGKRVYILRPCMVHGPGNKGNLNLLYQVVSKGIPWPMGAFANKRSFCTVANLCFIIHQMLEQTSIPSGIYNAADDEPLSTNEIIRMMAHAQHRNARIMHLPQQLLRNIARLGDWLHLPLNTERLEKLTGNYVVSNRKIKEALGKPLPFTSREGMLQTLYSFNKNAE